jgi:predicted metalloprotease with PDZ domain
MVKVFYNYYFMFLNPSVIRPLWVVLILLFFQSCGLLRNEKSINTPEIVVEMNLREVENDQLTVLVDPLYRFTGEVKFYLPKVVPGTYENSNFGRFVSDLKAFDNKGNLLEVERIDTNTWRIPKGEKLDRLSYKADDTFDGNRGADIYPMGGTKIEKGKVFLLNLHGFVGYFEGAQDWPYKLIIDSPKDLQPYTAMQTELRTKERDVFHAKRYFNIIDEPILYTQDNSISFELDAIKVNLAVHSPEGRYQATDFEATIFDMMQAQKRFLGPANTTESYDILLLLMDKNELDHFQGMQGALEHHRSTTVVFYELIELERLKKYMTDVVSHEFFHTLTPLNIHSEQVHNFNYNEGVMSQHLWMYEGTTEYFSHLFQVQENLIDEKEFYDRILLKINRSKGYNDSMSFTEMSTNIVNEPYQSNYSNVYQKGALINMCLDLLIREMTQGEKGILTILQQLAEKYGVDKPFEDKALIEEITAMTSDVVRAFFEKHIQGNTPIDYNVFFAKVGLHITEENSLEKTATSIPVLRSVESPNSSQLALRAAWLQNDN